MPRISHFHSPLARNKQRWLPKPCEKLQAHDFYFTLAAENAPIEVSTWGKNAFQRKHHSPLELWWKFAFINREQLAQLTWPKHYLQLLALMWGQKSCRCRCGRSRSKRERESILRARDESKRGFAPGYIHWTTRRRADPTPGFSRAHVSYIILLGANNSFSLKIASTENSLAWWKLISHLIVGQTYSQNDT